MDSMRSLNTSLPSSTTHRRRERPEHPVFQAFRTAALSVTNLYKTATAEQDSIRQTGYQEALDDLLSFLDKENLGLGDGEGWKVRQWATERLDDSGMGPGISESEDDRGDSDKKAASPVPQRKASFDLGLQPLRSTSPTRTGSAPPMMSSSIPESAAHPNPPLFTFTSAQAFPQPCEIDMQRSESNTSIDNESSESVLPVRVEMVPRTPRTPRRHGTSMTRHNTRSSIRDFSQGSSSKRKFQFGDFFDITGNNSDGYGGGGGGGGKRGRFA